MKARTRKLLEPGEPGFRKLGAAVLLLLWAGGGFLPSLLAQETNISDQLQAYWRFEGNLGDTTGIHYGVGKGTEPLTYSSGKFGEGLFLNGIDQSVVIAGGNEDDLDIFHRDRSFSLSLWCKAAAWANPWAEVIAKGPEENAWRIGRSGQSSGLTLSLGASSRGDRTIDVRSKFHHCALVFDHETHIARYYVNGVEQTRDICSIAENSSRVWIGGGPWPYSVGHWHGTIDDVAVWKRALSAGEVARLWNAGAGMELWQLLPDADADGQYDSWEEERGLNTQLDDAALDLDGDGLSNLEEAELNTDPRLADTDGDGLSDAVESRTGIRVGNGDTGTDPVSQDTDEDGLIDSDPLEPDPLDPDFDKDGAPDGFEIAYASDPIDPVRSPGLATSLIAYFPFDGGADDAGLEEHPVKVFPEGGTLSFEEGMFGQSLTLDGSAWIEVVTSRISSAFDFHDLSGFSIACWVVSSNPTGSPRTLVTMSLN